MAVMSWFMIASSLVLVLLPNKLHSQSDTTTFEFTKFGRNESDLILQGDAEDLNGYISLTPPAGYKWEPRVGRVLYSPPIRLWDRAGRRQANFQTVFTAKILGLLGDHLFNGLSFFIAPVNANIPTASTTGGNMGLYDASSGISPVPLVAVELDILPNTWDPNYRHLGININSRNSVAFERWQWDNFPYQPFEIFVETRITYDARQRLISVFANATTQFFSPPPPPLIGWLEYRYDLKTTLPEWVQIGFSSATGAGHYSGWGQNHHILNWSFISFMVSDDVNRPDDDNHDRQYV